MIQGSSDQLEKMSRFIKIGSAFYHRSSLVGCRKSDGIIGPKLDLATTSFLSASESCGYLKWRTDTFDFTTAEERDVCYEKLSKIVKENVEDI